MISERRFSETYTSFWRQALPRGEAVMRHLNSHLEPFDDPLASDLEPASRAQINEAGFRAFGLALEKSDKRWSPPPAKELARIWAETGDFLSPSQLHPEVDRRSKPRPAELEECVTLAHRLWTFFREEEAGRELVLSPRFRGCGMLSSSRGDVLAGQTLYEVKARAGNFQLVDLRQLVVYCALDRLERLGRIERIGLVNPRMGFFFRDDAGKLLASSSGTDPSELLTDVAEFLSSEGASG